MDLWYDELDYDDNPLTTDPRRSAKFLVGLDLIQDDLLYRVAASNMIFLEGKEGRGKSTLLWSVVRAFRGRKRVIFVDCSKLKKDLNVEKLLTRRSGIRGTLFKTKPKGMILLLDNVQDLSKRNSERIKYYFDQDYLRSVVFAAESLQKANLSTSINQRIGKRHIKLPDISAFEAVEIINRRMGDENILSSEDDALVTKIFSLSGGHVGVFLRYCERVAEHAVKNGMKPIKVSQLPKILKVDNKPKKDKPKRKPSPKKKAPKKGKSVKTIPLNKVIEEKVDEVSYHNHNHDEVQHHLPKMKQSQNGTPFDISVEEYNKI